MSDVGLAQARVETSLRSTIPYAQYEYVRVTFNATPNEDTDIKHALRAPDPEEIDFQVVGWEFDAAPLTAPVVYRDTSATRRRWGTNFIVLRCNVASATATLLLTIRPLRSQIA